MGYKAAVQILKKADALKVKLSTRNTDLLNDTQAWTDQQQLQTIYHQVLVLDLEYALDRKVEQELWTLGFKNHISVLQEQSRDKKNPRRSEAQALLSWCLEAASGFYLTLLQELCSSYDLDLPFRMRGAIFGNLHVGNYAETSSLPQAFSCLYICQYCLVHLGDIARYRNQRKQAESFYKHAILVSPTSGHPYNQLALLEASQGDKLSTVFHYVRGIAVKNPFPGAATNLLNTLSAAVDKDELLSEVQSKMSVNEFMALFLKVHGLLQCNTDLEQAELCVKSINATLTALVATQSFTTEKLIKMTVINLYALKHTVGDDIMKTSELTSDEITVRGLILDLIAGSLSAFLLPVYTLKDDDGLLDYYALPAIRLISMWIQNDPRILTDEVFSNRLQIWPGYCKLLNCFLVYNKLNDFNKYVEMPLTYDRELQGFLPLQNCFKMFDFSSDSVSYDVERQIRAKRLIEFGHWLSSYDVNGNKLMTCKTDGKVCVEFEPACIQPDPTHKLLEEMKSFKISDIETKIKVPEKRGGILKPQGSLEKSREERVQVKINEDNPYNAHSAKVDTVKLKRLTQNVALQSIYKKIEENKQVKFSAETSENGKVLPKMKTPIQRQPIAQPAATNNLPPAYRTQTFNQNHPALGNLSVDKPGDFFYQNPAANMNFPNNDLLKMPPISMPQNLQFSVPPPTTFNHPPSNVQTSNYASLLEKPFNMPPSYNYKEEQPAQNWWPNQLNPNMQQPQNDYFRFNNQYPNNMTTDYYSPWGNMPPRSNPGMNFGNANQGMTMRQAMLNETNHQPLTGNNSNNNNVVNNAPGYSLFNATSWSPTLPGQLRNGGMQDIRQQSLFKGPPAQSLQQLLEQQNQLPKGGDS